MARTPTNFILGKYVKDAQGDLWKISAVFKDSIAVVREHDGGTIVVPPSWLHERTIFKSTMRTMMDRFGGLE